jgi:hypothetical protein
VLYPVAGSGTLTQLEAADGWTPTHGDLKFTGYLIRLAVAATEVHDARSATISATVLDQHGHARRGS